MRYGYVIRAVTVCAAAAWSCAVACAGGAQEAPRSYGLERVADDIISGNTRLVIIGDSISIPSSGARTPAGIMMTWKPRTWRGVVDGAGGFNPGIFQDDMIGSPSGVLEVSATSIVPGRSMYQLTSQVGPRFAVPVRSIQEFVIFWSDVIGSGVKILESGGRNSLVRMQFDRSWYAGLPAAEIFGEKLRARILYLYVQGKTATNTDLEFRIWNGSNNMGSISTVNLETDGLHVVGGVVPDIECNAIELPVLHNHSTTDDVELLMCPPNSGVGQAAADSWAQLNHQKFVHLLGGMVYRDAPGLVLGALADSSWDYDSIYINTISMSGVPKRYLNSQVESWLRAIDVDSAQRPVFMVHVAPENRAMDEFGQVVLPITLGYSVEGFARYAKDGFERIVSRYRTICADLGWPEPGFILVGAWHRDFSTLARADAKKASEGQSLGAYWVALEQADVAYVSIYQDTDGAVFDGTDQSAEDWLDANGYGGGGQFEIRGNPVDLTAGVHGGGDLLDFAVVHQQDDQSAAFFAHRMWRMIVEDSCPADVDGDLVIDVNDVSAVLFALGDTGLAGAGPTALVGDANRDGVVDVNDISFVLFRLGDACPGGAVGAWPPVS